MPGYQAATFFLVNNPNRVEGGAEDAFEFSTQSTNLLFGTQSKAKQRSKQAMAKQASKQWQSRKVCLLLLLLLLFNNEWKGGE